MATKRNTSKENLPYFVYTLFDPMTHEPFYVGVTADLWNRYRMHMTEARRYANSSSSNDERCKKIAGLIAVGLIPGMAILEMTTFDLQFKKERKWQEAMQRRGVKLTNKRLLPHLTRREELASRGINGMLVQLVEMAADLFDEHRSNGQWKTLAKTFRNTARRARAKFSRLEKMNST